MTKYEELHTKLCNAFDFNNPNRLEETYIAVKNLASYIAAGTYKSLDREELDDLGHDVAAYLFTKMNENATLKVSSWYRYIKILLAAEYRHTYQESKLVFVDNTQDIDMLTKNLSITYDIDALLDLNQSSKHAYKKCMKILNKLPVADKERRLVLSRHIIIAATSNESLLEGIEPGLQRIARSFCALIKGVLRQFSSQGLLTCKSV